MLKLPNLFSYLTLGNAFALHVHYHLFQSGFLLSSTLFLLELVLSGFGLDQAQYVGVNKTDTLNDLIVSLLDSLCARVAQNLRQVKVARVVK